MKWTEYIIDEESFDVCYYNHLTNDSHFNVSFLSKNI